MSEHLFSLYSGDGSTITSRGMELPLYEKAKVLDDPAFYIADRALRDAVNVSLALGQPLLVTGEPGTGKTQLASSVAYELGLGSPLVFHTKTTSTAKDLFYRYDALRHFHDSQFRNESLLVDSYIEYEAFGLAILLANPPEKVSHLLPKQLIRPQPSRSVVLIDEIDKAPRDLPNDILNEIEDMSFTVRETGATFIAEPGYRPIVIMTSNSEKNLPEAFLRRCVYYHIPFPDNDRLQEIARRRLVLKSQFTDEMLKHAIQHFEQIRELALKKKPATAEFLAWLRILDAMGLDVQQLRPEQKQNLALSYSAVGKSKDDIEMLQKNLSRL